MSKSKPLILLHIVAFVAGSHVAVAEAEGGRIQEITFDSIPAGVQAMGDSIGLQGSVDVVGDLAVTGLIDAQGTGIRFSDGTIQITAATSNGSQSANSGLYDNRIPDFSPPEAYTEVCIKSGSVSVDIHALGEPTSGGNCVPGDRGWLIEHEERSHMPWAEAKMDCLTREMRLPEPFEFSYSCKNSDALGLSEMTSGGEWASNSAQITISINGPAGVAVPVMGFDSCISGTREFIVQSTGFEGSQAFRCVR